MLGRITRALATRHRRLRLRQARAVDLQSGAIPYAWVEGEPVYLLVTSRRTGRWIFPKGVIEADMSPAESAAKEAWEEAGVRGNIASRGVGVYRGEKVEGRTRRPITVELYPLEVRDQAGDWPERRRRRRNWATHRQARRLIDNAGLVAVLDQLHADLTATHPGAEAGDDGRRRKRRRQANRRSRTR